VTRAAPRGTNFLSRKLVLGFSSSSRVPLVQTLEESGIPPSQSEFSHTTGGHAALALRCFHPSRHDSGSRKYDSVHAQAGRAHPRGFETASAMAAHGKCISPNYPCLNGWAVACANRRQASFAFAMQALG